VVDHLVGIAHLGQVPCPGHRAACPACGQQPDVRYVMATVASRIPRPTAASRSSEGSGRDALPVRQGVHAARSTPLFPSHHRLQFGVLHLELPAGGSVGRKIVGWKSRRYARRSPWWWWIRRSGEPEWLPPAYLRDRLLRHELLDHHPSAREACLRLAGHRPATRTGDLHRAAPVIPHPATGNSPDPGPHPPSNMTNKPLGDRS
jgi:hypothetical protein